MYRSLVRLDPAEPSLFHVTAWMAGFRGAFGACDSISWVNIVGSCGTGGSLGGGFAGLDVTTGLEFARFRSATHLLEESDEAGVDRSRIGVAEPQLFLEYA